MPVVWSLHDEFAVSGGMIGDLERVLDRSAIAARWDSPGPLVKNDGIYDRYYAHVARWMPRPAALVCHSEHLRRLVRADPSWRHTPCHLVRIPVPIADEPTAQVGREHAKARFGFAPREPVVLMVASHFGILHKGIQFGIEALRKLPADQFRCLLVGEGARESVAPKIPQRSVCPGPIYDSAELALAYRAADVTLVPSLVESFGLVAAESLACETPVAAFRIGGLLELTGDGQRGLLAPAPDTDALAGAVDTLLLDPELRRRLGAAGREWILANCQAEQSFERMLSVYEEAKAAFASTSTRASGTSKPAGW
jgi:glycosyltransferase involved in cell wall biosynthesis